jgi:hypothetical protein
MKRIVTPEERARMEEVFAYADADNLIEGKKCSEYFDRVIRPGLLDGEITLDEAYAMLDAQYPQEPASAPKDDLWRAEDYDDEPRSNGNFGIVPSWGWKTR